MPSPPPAEIGAPFSDIDTPALIIDLDAFERNLDAMAAAVGQLGVRLRPHAKTHKSPVIAAKQIARGAVGMCCQKVAEAEILVAGGVGDVLVSNEVVGARKLERLASLARHARISVCVDDPDDDRATGAGRGTGRLADRGAGRSRRRRAALRRQAGPGGNRPGAADRGFAFSRRSAACRPIMARPSICARRRSGARQSPTQRMRPRKPCASSTKRAFSAEPSVARERGRSNWKAPAASGTSCRRAPTSSWTPTTRKTSPTGRAMPARSSMRSLFWRP